MIEKLNSLKTKMEELQNILKQNLSAEKEISNNIDIAEDNKIKIKENISKIQGVIEGLQYAIIQLEEVSQVKSDLEDKKIENNSSNNEMFVPEPEVI